MTVRLRGHHLLCIMSYVGRGYAPGFVANLDRVAERLSAGEDVLIVTGPDEICAPVAGDPESHCAQPSVSSRDALAAQGVSTVLGRPVAPGDRLVLDADAVGRIRAAFAEGTVRAACTGCQWEDACSGIAAVGFAETRLRPRN